MAGIFRLRRAEEEIAVGRGNLTHDAGEMALGEMGALHPEREGADYGSCARHHR